VRRFGTLLVGKGDDNKWSIGKRATVLGGVPLRPSGDDGEKAAETSWKWGADADVRRSSIAAPQSITASQSQPLGKVHRRAATILDPQGRHISPCSPFSFPGFQNVQYSTHICVNTQSCILRARASPKLASHAAQLSLGAQARSQRSGATRSLITQYTLSEGRLGESLKIDMIHKRNSTALHISYVVFVGMTDWKENRTECQQSAGSVGARSAKPRAFSVLLHWVFIVLELLNGMAGTPPDRIQTSL
jgi:hypothetical protein